MLASEVAIESFENISFGKVPGIRLRLNSKPWTCTFTGIDLVFFMDFFPFPGIYLMPEAATEGVKNFADSQENTCFGISF